MRKKLDVTDWYFQLKDAAIKSRIAARLKQAAMGNFGDHKGVGEGVMEMRIHTGSGIRIYYAQAGNTVYILLSGGDKSTQDVDIKKAQKLWKKLRENEL